MLQTGTRDYSRGYPALLDIGKSHVFVGEPEADEVHEDDAAIAVTEAICGENLEHAGPSEGKIQIFSAIDGLFCVNSDALRQINRVDDYTVACRPNYTRVSKGEKVSGARIVPLLTKRENVDKAVAIEGKLSCIHRPFIQEAKKWNHHHGQRGVLRSH
jgi:hypothetical protein